MEDEEETSTVHVEETSPVNPEETSPVNLVETSPVQSKSQQSDNQDQIDHSINQEHVLELNLDPTEIVELSDDSTLIIHGRQLRVEMTHFILK